MKFQSERLLFEPLSTEHYSVDYLNWLNDPETTEFLESGGDYTEQKLMDYLVSIEKMNIHFWAIRKKSNNQHIGNIKIDPVSKKHRRGEYGILIGSKDDWGMGYGREATMRVLRYCFDQLKLRKITLGVISENHRAVSLYEGIGFEIEGRYRKHVYYQERFCDVLRMAIFSEDYSDAE